MLQYQINASSEKGGKARSLSNKTVIEFDATPGRDEVLPNPAELLLTALAACILKNVERYSEMLQYSYKTAKITVKGERSDVPPAMQRIEYLLEIDTDIEERKLKNWHRNIIKFGTITNTLLRACEVKGDIKRL